GCRHRRIFRRDRRRVVPARHGLGAGSQRQQLHAGVPRLRVGVRHGPPHHPPPRPTTPAAAAAAGRDRVSHAIVLRSAAIVTALGFAASAVCGAQTNPMDSIRKLPSYRPALDTVTLLAPDRIARLAGDQRAEWDAYLARSRARYAADTAAMHAELRASTRSRCSPQTASRGWRAISEPSGTPTSRAPVLGTPPTPRRCTPSSAPRA